MSTVLWVVFILAVIIALSVAGFYTVRSKGFSKEFVKDSMDKTIKTPYRPAELSPPKPRHPAAVALPSVAMAL